MTQKDAAAKAPVSHRLWAEVERGERPHVSLDTALRMLALTGVTVHLRDASGVQVRVRSPASDAAARAARAAVRRATWGGRQITLREEGTEPLDHANHAERIAGVAMASRQALAVARGTKRR
jgi:hypothetical protein